MLNISLISNITFESLGSFVGIFYEGIIIIGMIIILIDLYRIYRVSKLSLTKNLLLSFIFLTLGIFFSWLAKWWLWMHGVSNYFGGYGLQLISTFKMSIACAIIGMYFLKLFFNSLFSTGNERSSGNNLLIIRKLIEVSIVLTVHIPAFLLNSPELGFISDAIAFFILLLDMTFLIPNALKSFRMGKKDKIFGKKFISIGLTAIFIFNMAIMFLLDRVTMFLQIKGTFNELGYTVFYFAAWTSVLISLIFAVYGFIKR
ncbi:MAG: hypothetical protein EU547_04740 [Promethearchaeota archaeon]|nr:MAG: hypothetical protein EU547_04740 [Candidatus Lokiarchaeota archaeon]